MKRRLYVLIALCGLVATANAEAVSNCPDTSWVNGFWSLGYIAMFVCTFIVGAALLALYWLLELPVRFLKWLLLAVGVASIYYGHSEPYGLPAGFWAFFGALGLGGFMFWFVALPRLRNLVSAQGRRQDSK